MVWGRGEEEESGGEGKWEVKLDVRHGFGGDVSGSGRVKVNVRDSGYCNVNHGVILLCGAVWCGALQWCFCVGIDAATKSSDTDTRPSQNDMSEAVTRTASLKG